MTSAPPPAAPPPTEPPSWPPAPAEPPSVRPQLRRSRTDKILGGVNGGLAEYSGVDALLWRVGFVALTLAGGTGVLLYLLLWVLLPTGPAVPPGTAVAPGAPLAQKPSGPRSPIPRITLAALLIVLGVLAMITSLTDWDLGARGVLGAALLVVGLGLVATAFSRGRAGRGGLIALGAVLSLAIAIVSTVDVGPHSGVGDRTYRPATVADVRDVYDGGVGDLTLDLTRLDLDRGRLDPRMDGDGLEIRIDHGVGDIEVLVPRSADVLLDIDNGLGDIDVFDGDSDGSGFVAGEGTRPWTDDDEPEFTLTIDSGVGDVEVQRG